MTGDDGIREVHGVAKKADGEPAIVATEYGNAVRIVIGHQTAFLGVNSARYLARALHRLARRIEQREPPIAPEPKP